jgi:hypothetical protein
LKPSSCLSLSGNLTADAFDVEMGEDAFSGRREFLAHGG